MHLNHSTIHRPFPVSWFPISVLLPAFLIFLVALTACNPSDDDQEEITVPVPKIKTITFYQSDAMARYFTYEYDSLGRCIKVSVGFEPSAVAFYDTYRYQGDLIIYNRFANGTDTNNPDTLHLNKPGLVIWNRLSYFANEYDRNGYLVQAKTANNVSTPILITCQISKGNTVKRTDTEGTTDQKITTTTFTFIPNSVNTIGYQNRGMAFYGKQDKNLVQEVHTAIGNWPSETTISYEYEYDAQKRVIKRTYIGDIPQKSETYTYYD